MSNKVMEAIEELEHIFICEIDIANQQTSWDNAINTIKQHIINRQEEIERKTKTINELNDTLEITVITEMLDLIKNGTPIPPTRKELQSKLDEYEEVVGELLKNNVVMFAGRVNGKTHFMNTINRLKRVYKKYKIKD